MVITIPELLTAEQIEAVCSVLRQGRFVDGRLSAGRDAAPHKNNLELDTDAERQRALNDVVMTSLVQHPLYLQAAIPARICAPIYARYLDGMEYGGHIHDPVMGAPASRYRSDISVTVFLNSPDEYEGGELCVDSLQGSEEYKLPAGHALLYPSTRYHAVKPVTRGERLVAVTWVQSHVRHAEQREILFRLDRVRASLAGDASNPAYREVNLCYANLLRMWAEA